MPLLQKMLRLFVSSPNDCADERIVVDEIVNELNRTWSASNGIRFEVIKWETHAFPAAGPSAQATINAQIGEAYDIYLGIMWGRFGTPTADYDSGTEEEARRALHRYRSNPDTVKIMFYFKDAPLPPSRVDTVQLARLQEFKRELGTEGVLYWTFTDLDQFGEFVRLHLSRVTQSYGTENATRDRAELVDGTSSDEDEQEELGLLDFLELAQGNIETFTACLGRIISAMEDSTASNKHRTAQFEAINKTGTTADNVAAKKLATLMAEDWLTFVRRIEAETPIFAESYHNALKYAVAAANISVADFRADPSTREKRLSELLALRQAITQAGPNLSLLMEAVEQARQTALRFPRVNVILNKAKRRISEAFGKLVEKRAFAEKASREALQLLDQLIEQVQRENAEADNVPPRQGA
jgi:Domain of unknown function (DUF4062)